MTRISDELPPSDSYQASISRADVAFVVVIVTALFLLRVFGPPTLMDHDQERPAAYALDALVNGNWLVQVDQTGDVMSKPPFSTWITAGFLALFGESSLFGLYLQSWVSTLLLSLMILLAGGRYFGRAAGLIGATIYVFSGVVEHQIALTRSDAVFSALVFGAALLAWRGWRTGKGWLPFWLIVSAATLTKGPLGLLLALGGLWAVLWQRGDGVRNLLRPVHVTGIVLFLLICGGWFWLSVLHLGDAVVDKMIRSELVDHAVGGGDRGHRPLTRFYIPPAYFTSGFFPWSLATLVALWGVFRRPAPAGKERQFERYLAAYFLGGLAIFAVATSHRYLHLWPLIPAGAILAGRRIAYWLPAIASDPGGKLYRALGTLSIVGLIVVGTFNWYDGQHNPRRIDARQIRDAATELDRDFGRGQPYLFHHVPYGLQFFLGTMEPLRTREEILEALESEEEVFIVTRNPEGLMESASPGTEVRTIREWHFDFSRKHYLVTNRPE